MREKEGHVLSRPVEVEVGGRRPAGIPRETWRQCVEDKKDEHKGI